MLRALRASTASGPIKTIIYGLLMAGALGLGLSSGYSAWSGSRQNTSVATIGRQDIDASTFNISVRRQLAQQGLDPHMAWQMHYIDQLLKQQIDSALLVRATFDLGLRVSDDMVRKQVEKIIAPYVTTDMTATDALNALLRSQNESRPEFINDVRAQTADVILRGALQDGTGVMSDQEGVDLALYQNERRTLDTVFLPDSSVKDYQQPSDAVLKPLYQSGQERYALPETRSFTLAILSDKSAATAQVSDADLQKAYADQKQTFILPERRTLDQAIMADEKQAQSVAASAKGGKALKDAVKAVTGATDDYTGTQDYQREGMDKAIADAAFTAPKGGVIGPIHSPLGWHVMVVQAITPPSVQPFDAVKDKLRRQMAGDKASQGLYNTSTQLDDALSGGATLEEAAKTYHLDLVKLGPVHKDGSTADSRDGMKDYVKDSPAIMKAAYSLSEGETSQVISLSNNRYAAIRMDKITPKSYKPFEQVKGDLSKLWIADQQNILNKQRAGNDFVKLKSGALTLDALASQNDASIKKLSLSRADKPAAPLTQKAQDGFFDTTLNQYAMEPVAGGYMLAKVSSVTLPDPNKLPADQLKNMRQASMGAMQNEISQAYLDSLQKQYKVTIHEDTLASMYAKDTSQPVSDGNGPNDQ